MKKVYIQPLAELVTVCGKTDVLQNEPDMSGEVDWGMGNQQNIFEEDNSSLPKPSNLWGEDDKADDKI